MGRLANKVAIVTGAASPRGFGFATAALFVREGAKVILTDIHANAVLARAAELTADDYDAVGAEHDVSSEKDWGMVRDLALTEFGRIDILINNAGIVEFGDIANTSMDQWNRHISVNLTGVFLGCQTAVRQMRAQRSGGSIVNISSSSAQSPFPNLAAYVASKGGVRLLTKSAALDVAEEGIRINSIYPGHIHTEMMDRSSNADAAMIAAAHAGIPMKKMGSPLDIAMMNLFLASDEARYITGAEFTVDGGLTAK